MPKLTSDIRETLKGYFAAGQKPTAEQFVQLIDAFLCLIEDGIDVGKEKVAISKSLEVAGGITAIGSADTGKITAEGAIIGKGKENAFTGTIKAGKFSGPLTGDVTGNVNGNLTGNTVKAGKFSGPLTGDVTGNLTGNVNGNLTGNVTGGTGQFSGNVGIGAPSPGVLLHLEKASDFSLRLTHTRVGTWEIKPSTNQTIKQFRILDADAGQNRLIIDKDGNVGIGNVNPTKAKLQIEGAVNVSKGRFAFYNANHNTGKADCNSRTNYSIWANDRVAGGEFNAFSDARTKTILGRSMGERDLLMLMAIEITDYVYRDTVAKGVKAYKKVIAQQVEDVFEQAVSRATDVVPDIYQNAACEDGWVNLATNLKRGERVRLIGEEREGIHEVLEVGEDRFRTDFAEDGDHVFVYGREVNDFRTVDYDAISMLNVSATQELARKLEKQTAELAARDATIAALEQRVAFLEARDDAHEQRLAALEALLLDPKSSRPPSARNSSVLVS